MPWVSRPRWIPNLCASSPWCNGFLRFTSGATPADLLVASIANDEWWTFKNNRLFNDLIWLHLISHLAWTANFGANDKNSSDRIIWTVIMLRYHFLNKLSERFNCSLFRWKWFATSQIQIFLGLFYSYFQVAVQKTSNFIPDFISWKYLQAICFPEWFAKRWWCCVYLYDLKGTKCYRTCLTMSATRNNRNMWDSRQILRFVLLLVNHNHHYNKSGP